MKAQTQVVNQRRPYATPSCLGKICAKIALYKRLQAFGKRTG